MRCRRAAAASDATTGSSSPHHAFARRAAVARMQRGQLDRDAGTRADVRVARVRAPTDDLDRVPVRREVALRVGGRQRGLAEHVVRIAIAAAPRVATVVDRVADRLAGHELPPEHPHREVDALADQRLAAARDEARQRRRQPACAVRRDEPAGHDETPRRRVDEQRRALADVCVPVAAADLVADQRVARRRVRNAQQRLGEAHQRDALVGRQRELAHQRVDASGLDAPFAQRLDEPRRVGADTAERLVAERRRGQQVADAARLRRPRQRVDRASQRRPRRRVGREVECHLGMDFKRQRGSIPMAFPAGSEENAVAARIAGLAMIAGSFRVICTFLPGGTGSPPRAAGGEIPSEHNPIHWSSKQ